MFAPSTKTAVRGNSAFLSRPPRRHQIRSVPSTRAQGEFVDYYGVLDVDRSATVAEIRQSFRRLQKHYHPDVSGDEEMSSMLNKAYGTLTDPELRSCYDRRLASVPLSQRVWKRTLRDEPGIVGPLSDAELVMQRKISDSEDNADEQLSRNVIWLREWAKTFIFAADIPLPLPLQCDDIDNGVRLAFMTSTENRVHSAGELHFVMSADAFDDTTNKRALTLSVYRIVPSTTYGIIPGEGQVMKNLANALKDKREVAPSFFGFELSGLLASAAAQFMPALVGLPGDRIRGSSYEAYHLKHPAHP